MKLSEFITVAALSVAMLSCEKSNLGTVDVQTEAPLLSNASTTPDSIYIDNLTPVNGLYSINTTVKVKMSFRGGDQSLTASVLRPTTSQEVASIALRDDGITPDQTAKDSIFSGQIQFSIQRTSFGRYRVRFVSRNAGGVQSNTLEQTLILARANSAPSLSNAGIKPSTPPGSGSDSTRVLLTITASDSDGIGDLRRVSVQPLNTTNTSAKALLDNGDLPNGDQVAGDGIYSALVWIKPITTLQNVEFVFTSSDKHNALSNEVRRLYANHSPIILNLNVPTTIQRPPSGSRLVPFYQTVADSDGLGDIDSVFFRNFSSTNPINILMYDDGDIIAHGDSVANNGEYSRLVSIDATNSTGPKEFHFYVIDRFGARDSLIKIITIN